MKKQTICFLVAIGSVLLISANASFAKDEKFQDNLDGGKISCKSPSGDEIKKWQTYTATSDRFFVEGSIKIEVVSGGAPKSHQCTISNIKRKDIKVKTEAGDIDVSVISEFDAFAGADCGTDIAKYVGKTAYIECNVSAISRKYSNE